MYVCLCRGVTEREIKQACEDGASSLGDLHRELGVGSDCGRCRCKAREMLHQFLARGEVLPPARQPLRIHQLQPVGRRRDAPPPVRAVA